MCFVGRRCLLKPLDYVFMSPPAYMPTENNVPIIISCQKQDYGLQILYHALFKIASKGNPCVSLLMVTTGRDLFPAVFNLEISQSGSYVPRGILNWVISRMVWVKL